MEDGIESAACIGWLWLEAKRSSCEPYQYEQNDRKITAPWYARRCWFRLAVPHTFKRIDQQVQKRKKSFWLFSTPKEAWFEVGAPGCCIPKTGISFCDTQVIRDSHH